MSSESLFALGFDLTHGSSAILTLMFRANICCFFFTAYLLFIAVLFNMFIKRTKQSKTYNFVFLIELIGLAG